MLSMALCFDCLRYAVNITIKKNILQSFLINYKIYKCHLRKLNAVGWHKMKGLQQIWIENGKYVKILNFKITLANF